MMLPLVSCGMSKGFGANSWFCCNSLYDIRKGFKPLEALATVWTTGRLEACSWKIGAVLLVSHLAHSFLCDSWSCAVIHANLEDFALKQM